jgi:hypothetical protein
MNDQESRRSGIFHFTHNMRTHVGAECGCRHEFNPSVQQVLQQDSKVHEMVEGLLVGFEFDEKIYVAVNALFSPSRMNRRVPVAAHPAI